VSTVRLLLTGGSGVLGRALVPLAEAAGHEVIAPRHADLDLFDPPAVARAVAGVDAILHLATRIPGLDHTADPRAWRENDRLRAEASRNLVDAALRADTQVYVQPTVAVVYPDGPADETTPLGEVPDALRSALSAERQAERFAHAGRRGIVLRLGLLDGPGTGHDAPVAAWGASLHVADAASALLAALTLPSSVYNVCRDGERVSNRRLRSVSGWSPAH
jgi:nucleoside-diphosphate-sugar epimerase